MPKQPAFPDLRHAMKKKQTRREKSLGEMEVVVPWARLLTLIALHYLKTRYRGLAKNRPQLFTLFALGNLFVVRRKLIA
jgi:IS5 family transposase